MSQWDWLPSPTYDTKRIRLTVAVRCVAAVVVTAGTLLAAGRWGVRGTAVALALASAFTTTAWWIAVGGSGRPDAFSWIPGLTALRGAARLVCVRWRHRRPRSEDLFVVSYPKSGNTWLRFVLADAFSGDEPDFDSVERLAPRAGEHHSAQPLVGLRGRLVKSHEPRHAFFDAMPGRHLYVVRDGRDVAVSYYYHMLRRGLIDPDFSSFLQRFLVGQVDNYGRWTQHVVGWLDAARENPDRVAVVRYEDLLEQAPGVTQTALQRLRCESPVLDDAFARHHSDEMRKKESTSTLLEREQVRRINFVRGARSGDWQSHFSSADLDLFWLHAGDAMRAAGYRDERVAVRQGSSVTP